MYHSWKTFKAFKNFLSSFEFMKWFDFLIFSLLHFISTVHKKKHFSAHMLELKKSFARKLGLLKKSRFLPRNVRLDLYFKAILPSVTYGLILWGSCCNSDLFQSLERLHCRAARLIFNLPKDMASVDVLQRAQWPTLSIYYKSAIFICFHKAFHDRLSVTLIDLISKKRATNYLTRTCASLIVPRFSTRATWKTLSRLEAQSCGMQWI